MSRLEKSAKNITFTIGSNILESLLGVVSRTVFIYTLGSEYLGLAGLLSNILGFLSITELGIATAIGFSLYKPLAENDYKSVSALMSLYRKAYCIIAGIVLLCGIGLFFFLDFFPLFRIFCLKIFRYPDYISRFWSITMSCDHIYHSGDHQ